MKNQNWVKILNSFDRHKLELIKVFLLEQNIDAIILSKQDSMYINLNNVSPVELYVANDNVITAKHLIKKQFKDE